MIVGLDQANLGHMVKKGEYDYPAHLSMDSKVLVTRLLSQSPSNRPSFREVSRGNNDRSFFMIGSKNQSSWKVQ